MTDRIHREEVGNSTFKKGVKTPTGSMHPVLICFLWGLIGSVIGGLCGYFGFIFYLNRFVEHADAQMGILILITTPIGVLCGGVSGTIAGFLLSHQSKRTDV